MAIRGEVTALLDEMKNEEAKKIVIIAAFTGLRKGEILSLKKKNWQEPNIVLESKNTKSKKSRIVPVVEAIRPLLTPPFKVAEITLRRDFNQAREAIERPEIRFHDLRHSFASWLVKNPDIPLTVIRDLMGHSSLSVTSKYAHLRDDHNAILEQTLPTNIPTKLH